MHKLLTICWLVLIGMSAQAQKKNMTTPYQAGWKQADSLASRGLYRSAFDVANRIYAQAKADANYPELIKAAMQRGIYNSFLDSNKAYLSLISSLQTDVKEVPEPARSALSSVLGEIYWQYYQQNRWKLMNRTAVAPGKSAELAVDTWDAKQLVAATTQAYLASIRNASLLQQTPVTSYSAVILSYEKAEPYKAPTPLRPTLFDVMAHRAISFFQNTEADIQRPVFRFELDQANYLSNPQTFARLNLQSQDSLSGRFLALETYQQLIRFHLNDTDPSALSDVDVLRLKFVHQYSVLPDKEERYKQVLQAEGKRHAGKPAEGDYLFALAELLADANPPVRPLRRGVENSTAPGDKSDKWDKKQAAEICRELIRQYPETVPGQNARNLLASLSSKQLDITIEGVVEPLKPFRALIGYQNVNKLYYRIYRVPVLSPVYNQQASTEADLAKRITTLAKTKAVAVGQANLTDDGDLQRHTIEIPLGALPAGHYRMVASSSDKFSAETDEIRFADLVVSNLSYLTDNEYDRQDYQLYVVHRQTGERQKDVTAVLYHQLQQGAWAVDQANSASLNQAGGRIAIRKTLPAGQYYFRLIQGNDTLNTEQFYSNNYRPAETPEERKVKEIRLFTDRAIYRPGQPIYFKGLYFEGGNNAYKVVANESVEVVLLDANSEQVSKMTLKTNEFGTFQGSFIAKAGKLTGVMTIGTEIGSTRIRVEEYKRPTFEVTSPPVEGTFRLGQPVSVSANAKTFAGAVLDGASVRYRVTRKLYQPWWEWGWWRPRPVNANAAEIASGVATMNAKGETSITFTAAPDLSVDVKSNPVFEFDVTFDVTDRNGETRSTLQTVRVSYSGLELTLPIPAQIDNRSGQPVEVKITNTANKPVQVQSELVIYRLTPPARALRKRLWEKPDYQLLSRAEYEQQFPHDIYDDEDDIVNWPKQEVARISNPGAVTLAKGYASGEYMAELLATDAKTGAKATKTAYFSVLNPEKPDLSVRTENFVRVEKAEVPVGQNAVFWIGSQPANGWVLMTVEEQGKTAREEWIQIGDSPKRIELPVLPRHQTAKYRRGFVVHFATVRFGRLYTQTQNIRIPADNKELKIETLTFRDKLKPGQPEEWTLRVSGTQKDRIAAEMVATLYDASLDAFAPLNWPTSFYASTDDFSQGWHSQSFGTHMAWVPFWRNQSLPPTARHYYPFLTWGNFVFTGSFSRPFQYQPFTKVGTIANGSIQFTIDRKKDAITGRALDSEGQPVPGITIVLKSTKKGTVTDQNGEFSLETTEKKPELSISMVGFIPVTVTINKARQKVTMRPDAQALNEVVVVGYGTKRKSDVIGSVSTVNARVAAAPAAETITLRGTSSVNPEGNDVADMVEQFEKGRNQTANTASIRRNFSETAFFFPQLQTDKEGRILLKFTMPEALTRWRLLAFAHTKDMLVGTLEKEVVTQKELMITANSPRFLREGDTLRLAARINNLTEKGLSGTARLDLINALTGDIITDKLLKQTTQTFTTAPQQSTALGWVLVVPSGIEAVTYRLTAQSGSFSDGEEQTIPVLPNRMLVTDALPFWVDGNEKRTFTLDALAKLNPEMPVRHERLTVEVSANPVWSALQSIPYLMEYPYECSEQLFSRLYANSLAAYILDQKPVFRQAIERWKTDPVNNPLEANAELKALLLENTPWLRDAKSQKDRQARLAQFFDVNRLANEQQQALEKLSALQTAEGGFRWFGGMEANPTITMHIVAGFGHLAKLGVRFPGDLQPEVDNMMDNAIKYVDTQMKDWVSREKAKNAWIGYSALQYLYARSFYLQRPIPAELLTYFKPKVVEKWLNESLQGQAMSMITLNRLGDKKTAATIMASLRERATNDPEMGMYWAENTSGLRWYQAPIETQALLIEAFDDMGADKKQLDNLCKWLLRQKQTQAWPSTKATTEAVYALLLRTNDWTNPSNTVVVNVGGIALASRVDKTEALTGYQKTTFGPGEIQPAMGRIEVQKKGNGPAFGAMYWQHFEPLDKVVAGSTGLSVQKTLYIQRDSPAGPVISPVDPNTSLKPGDLIKVRVVLATDRDMEYVHLKDSRAAGFEPVSALSGYKFQNGLGYYQAPRDFSSDFFISYLNKGTHVFEYELRVSITGDFSAGVATVQCFYAPEFTAHSTGSRVKVR